MFVRAVLLAAGCGAPTVADLSYPPLTGRVVDEAELLSPADEAALAERSEDLEQRTGAQLVFVTLPTVAGRTSESFEYYTLNLANHWGIGRAGHNDGVMVLVARDDRRVRIEVGEGLEGRLTDGECAAILDEQVGPRFGQGDYAGGLTAAGDWVVAQLTSDP